MSARWPTFHKPALAWIKRVERAIEAREPDAPGPYMAITNAIEHHFEIGADRETVRCLIAALTAYTKSCGVEPSGIEINGSPDRILDRLHPRKMKTR